jgi:hypothetical protein
MWNSVEDIGSGVFYTVLCQGYITRTDGQVEGQQFTVLGFIAGNCYPAMTNKQTGDCKCAVDIVT